MKTFIQLASILMFTSFFTFQSKAQSLDTNSWAYDSIHIPIANTANYKSKPVIAAVVDDAFRLSHAAFQDFIYINPIEIPGNQLDDDGNNYIDDVSGWDISDNDNDVSVLEGRDKDFFHGSYVASIITNIASLYYGDDASNRIKIMPVKVLSDRANTTYLKDGYKGIKYAMDNGADIICLSWSGGNPGDEDLKIIQEAQQKGILIIASAGNFNEEKILNPAQVPRVLAVAGINRFLLKEEHSNYGMRVDISAPAESVLGAHPEKDNAFIKENGTSASAALVAGCAAVILSKNEKLTADDIKEALLNSATPFGKSFSKYGGKMGAGIVNLENALDYISQLSNKSNSYSSLRSKGSIAIDAQSAIKEWEIAPAGSYLGFYLEPDVSNIKKPEKHSFQIILSDTVWAKYKLSNIPRQLFVPAPSLTLEFQNSTLKKQDVFKIAYQGKTIDSTKLYCSELRYLSEETGSVDDGSGEFKYANNSSCRWLITLPEGKRIKFIFDQMDTQANVDFVYLVDGQTAIPENFIAKFSGQKQPPVVYSRSNEVLVWFVTDASISGQGWQFHYEAVD